MTPLKLPDHVIRNDIFSSSEKLRSVFFFLLISFFILFWGDNSELVYM